MQRDDHNDIEFVGTVAPPHPGETLLEDFLKPIGMTPHALAMAIHVPATRVSEIVKGKRGVTAETALRLGRYFGTTAQFWMNLQAYYDLATAEDALRDTIEREVRPRPMTPA
jgi:addiction module HigA family antidote